MQRHTPFSKMDMKTLAESLAERLYLRQASREAVGEKRDFNYNIIETVFLVWSFAMKSGQCNGYKTRGQQKHVSNTLCICYKFLTRLLDEDMFVQNRSSWVLLLKMKKYKYVSILFRTRHVICNQKWVTAIWLLVVAMCMGALASVSQWVAVCKEKKWGTCAFPIGSKKKTMSQKYGTHYRTEWPEARTLLRLDSSESGDAALSGQSLVDIVALYFFTFPHGKYL